MIIAFRRQYDHLGRVFLVLWSLAFYLHFAETPSKPHAALSALLVLLLARFLYDFRIALGIFLIFSTSILAYKLPGLANHNNFFLLMNLWLIFSFLRGRGQLDWPATSRALLYGLAAVYFWAGVHKLNVDFFEADVSCANEMLQRFFNKYMDGRAAASKFTAFPFFAVLMELGVALLLVFRRTTIMGLVFAMLLHAFLATIGFVDFASVALAILLSHFFHVTNFSTKNPQVLWKVVDYYLLAQALAGCMMILNFRGVLEKWIYFAQVLALLWIIFWIIWSAFRMRAAWPQRFSWVPMLSILAFGSFNYLGLSTAGTFSMFSNLRTEGQSWNHFFMPRALRIFSYQDRVYWVHSLSEEFHSQGRGHPAVGMGLPPLEISRLYSEWREDGERPEVFMLYDSDDWHSAAPISAYIEVPFEKENFGFWEKKLLSFRQVQRYGKNLCRW